MTFYVIRSPKGQFPKDTADVSQYRSDIYITPGGCPDPRFSSYKVQNPRLIYRRLNMHAKSTFKMFL